MNYIFAISTVVVFYFVLNKKDYYLAQIMIVCLFLT